MDSISLEQVETLIEIATKKDFFDYISILIPLIAVWMTYLIFQKHYLQIINEKVIEKDVEKLYEAVDCFFDFSDAVGLFFSMYEKKIGIILSAKNIDATFEEKLQCAKDDFYLNLRKVNKAIFLLRALGRRDEAVQVDSYRKGVVLIRKELLALMAKYEEDKDPLPLTKFIMNFSERVSKLNNDKDSCLDGIANCKNKLTAPNIEE
jgi:hypothetical protein